VISPSNAYSRLSWDDRLFFQPQSSQALKGAAQSVTRKNTEKNGKPRIFNRSGMNRMQGMTGIFVRSVGFRVAHDSNHAGHSAPEGRHTWRMIPIMRNVNCACRSTDPCVIPGFRGPRRATCCGVGWYYPGCSSQERQASPLDRLRRSLLIKPLAGATLIARARKPLDKMAKMK